MSEPDLNLLHRDTFTEKQAGTCMPEVMEANLFEVVLLDYPCKVFRYIIGAEKLSGLVDTDVVKIISTVGLFKESTVRFLLVFLLEEKLLNLRDQGKGSEARFCF